MIAPMEIRSAVARPPQQGAPERFTGSVSLEPIITAPAPAGLRASLVTFSPGARTAWHTHPLGQTLFVQSGLGRVQKWGEAIQTIRPGDVVWIAPGEKHWHGASPTQAMSHIAMHEALGSDHVTWLEHVSDAQYAGK